MSDKGEELIFDDELFPVKSDERGGEKSQPYLEGRKEALTEGGEEVDDLERAFMEYELLRVEM